MTASIKAWEENKKHARVILVFDRDPTSPLEWSALIQGFYGLLRDSGHEFFAGFIVVPSCRGSKVSF